MQLQNTTPFAHLTWSNEDARWRLFDILIVKASYVFNRAGRLVRSPEQEPLNFTDRCYGEVNVSSLCEPSDLVPYKPCTDILVSANAHAPEGRAATQWRAGISVAGADHRLSHHLRVLGPRWLMPRWLPGTREALKEEWQTQRHMFRGWRLSQPEPATVVPLRWEHVYGGMCETGDGLATDERNPLGCGWINSDHTDRRKPLPAPQLEAPGAPYEGPESDLEPVGFGPVPPAWLPRRPLGGTFDQRWIDEVWPHWPEDYDFAYHNSAPPQLRWPGFLSGEERVVLSNLRPEQGEMGFDLPGEPVFAQVEEKDGRVARYRMNLDTLYLDLTPGKMADVLITLTWRLVFLDERVAHIQIETGRLTETGGVQTAPHPSELFAQNREVA